MKTISDFSAHSAWRLGGASGRRTAMTLAAATTRRAAMMLLLMVLTTATAWAEEVTAAVYTVTCNTMNTPHMTTLTRSGSSNSVTWNFTSDITPSPWAANASHGVNDEYDITFKPNKALANAGNVITTSAQTKFTVTVGAAAYYIKSATIGGVTANAGLNAKSIDVTVPSNTNIQGFSVTLTTDNYHTVTPANGLKVTSGTTATEGNTTYYKAGTTVTIAPTNQYHIIEGTGGIGSATATVADDKRSFSFTMPEQNVSPSATLTEVHTITVNSPDLSVTSSPYFTYSSTKYYKKGVTYTLTVDDANKIIESFNATGADGSIATNKKSATLTIGNSDVTVTATIIPDPTHFAKNSDGSYTIKSVIGWGLFCELLEENAEGYFTGKTVNLDGNIGSAANPVTSMAGTSSKPFTGTFDGKRYKLTVSYQNTSNTAMTAPFAYVDGATIQNLVVDGSITGSAYRAAGVIGETGTNKSYITNCVSSLTISSGRYTGGFSIGGNVEIKGCVFNGKINGNESSGGFVGYSNSNLKIKDCLFAPQSGSSISGGTFYFNGGGEITPTNCYYTTALGTAQGTAPRSVTKGDQYVTTCTVSPIGSSTDTYDLSGITAYNNGIIRNGTFYYGKGDQVSLTLAHSDRTGYNFNSYTASAGTLNGKTLTMPDANVTISTTWTAITYSVAFDGNGYTSGSMNNQSFAYDEAQNLTANAFKRVFTMTYHYNGATGGNSEESATATATFNGWAKSKNGAKVYDDGQLVSNLTNEGNATVTLFANWTDASVTLPTPAKTGYTFAGWYTDSELNTRLGDAGDAYTPSEDITLYANWTPITYYVAFDGNGATSGSMDNQAFYYDVEQALADNAYRRAFTVTYHYNGATGGNSEDSETANATFNGWATTDNGAVDYNNQQSVTNLADTNGATVNLFANWTDASVTLPTPAKTGYTFAGWYTDSELNTRLGDAGDAYTPTANITLYAKWHVPYIDADGTPQQCADYTVLTGSETELDAGWYVAESTLNYSETIWLYGEVHLILKDGAVMNVGKEENPIDDDGISGNDSFSIYAQSTGGSKGQLYVNATDDAIYAENVTINGGQVTANGDYGIWAVDGNVTISGGQVTASGNNDGIHAYGNVTISGGQVTASGNNDGIDASGNVTISGGQVTANGDTFGIHAYGNVTLGWTSLTDFIQANSYYSASGTVSIAEGKAFAVYDGETLTSYLPSGTLTRQQVSALGGKTLRPVASIPVVVPKNLTITNVTTTGATLTWQPGNVETQWQVTYSTDGGNTWSNAETVTETTYTLTGLTAGTSVTVRVRAYYNDNLYSNFATSTFTTLLPPVSYLDADGSTKQCANYTVLTGSETYLAAGLYVAESELTYSQTITLNGDVHLILKDGAVMNVGTEQTPVSGNGISGNDSFSIYAQSTGDSKGQLHVNAKSYAIYAKNVTINGGKVTANGDTFGIHANGGNVTISGGQVTANGGSNGIVASGNVTISGGQVTASGGDFGIYTSAGNVTISGGQVTANGNSIFGIMSLGNVTINGGQVTANGGSNGIVASGNVTLGWTSLTDFIQANSYDVHGTVSIAEGKSFAVYDGETLTSYLPSGTLTSQQVSALGGKTLRPVDNIPVVQNLTITNVTLTGATLTWQPGNVETQWQVTYSTDGGNTWSEAETVTETTYTLTGLTAETSVTVRVRAYYNDNLYSDFATSTFTTLLPSVSYLDADGNPQQCTDYTVLTGSETSLAEGWYVAESTLNYSQTIRLNGEVHLILKDGAVMNVDTEESPISGVGISGGYDHSLNIYAQSTDNSKGQLYINAKYEAIFTKNVTINGGQVTANGLNSIYTNGGNVTICGGQVTANGGGYGIYAYGGNVTISGGQVTANGGSYGGIYIDGGNVTISGGQVTANGSSYGIIAYGDLTLGWTSLTDFIQASSYYSESSVSIAEGKAFVVYDGESLTSYLPSGTLTSQQVSAIGGKTLRPVADNVVPYIDAEGNTQLCTDYTVLTGSEISLAEGWYVARGTLNYGETITLSGKVHLILQDGAVMNVGTEQTPVNNGIYANGHSLSIYTQSTGGGKLNLYADPAANGIDMENGDLTIHGGEVTATGAIAVDGGTLTLGWTSLTDFIKANSYKSSNGTISIAEGKAFKVYDGESLVAILGSGTLSSEQVATLGGKTLRPSRTSTLEAPQHLVASLTLADALTSARLSWQSDDDVSQWQVACSTDGGSTWSDDVTVTEPAYSVTGLTEGTTLTVRVRSVYSATICSDYTTCAFTALSPVAYLDAEGTRQYCDAYTTLNGTETSIGIESEDSWYVASGRSDYDGCITLAGNVHLILADDAEVNFPEINPSGTEFTDFVSIYAAAANLTIYGQTEGTGTINAKAYVVVQGDFTVNGGTLNATVAIGMGLNGTITTEGNFIINGGTVFAQNPKVAIVTSSDDNPSSKIIINGGKVTAISGYYGIFARNDEIIIRGGQVTAQIADELLEENGIDKSKTIGIAAVGNITLGATKASDFICADRYYTRGTLSIADGTTLYDEDGNTYSGIQTLIANPDANPDNFLAAGTYAIDGKTLRPVELLVLADNGNNGSVISENAGQTRSVMLQGRTLYKDGDWNTLCLPFDVVLAGSPLDGDGVDVRTLSSSSFSGGTLTLNFTPATGEEAVTTLQAGRPYIIRWPDTGKHLTENDLVFPGVTIPSGYTSDNAITEATASSTDYVDFIGTFSPTLIYEDGTAKHNLYLAADNTLYYPTATDFQLRSCRAYFQLKNGLTAGEPSSPGEHQVRAFNLNFSEEETQGISLTPSPSRGGEGSIYTLSGVKVDKKPTRKGVYIVNGRKVVVK